MIRVYLVKDHNDLKQWLRYIYIYIYNFENNIVIIVDYALWKKLNEWLKK
jgi:hypothetical protein